MEEDAARRLAVLGRAPELVRVDPWFNTPDGEPLTLAALRDRVVLLEFWTFACVNCQRTLPFLRRMHDQGKEQSHAAIVWEEAHPTKGENMSVEEILGTHRRPLIADVATLAACIDECAVCAATCTIAPTRASPSPILKRWLAASGLPRLRRRVR
jgi:thiol-disulfide isomerase/thioredoxin